MSLKILYLLALSLIILELCYPDLMLPVLPKNQIRSLVPLSGVYGVISLIYFFLVCVLVSGINLFQKARCRDMDGSSCNDFHQLFVVKGSSTY